MADLSASGARSAYTRSVTNHAAIRTPATSFYVSKHLKPRTPIETSPIGVGGGVWADRPGGRRHCVGRGDLRHRQRQCRVHAGHRLRREWLQRAVARWLFPLTAAIVAEVLLTFFSLLTFSWHHRESDALRFFTARHRPGSDAYPPDQHSDHQYLSHPARSTGQAG